MHTSAHIQIHVMHEAVRLPVLYEVQIEYVVAMLKMLKPSKLNTHLWISASFADFAIRMCLESPRLGTGQPLTVEFGAGRDSSQRGAVEEIRTVLLVRTESCSDTRQEASTTCQILFVVLFLLQGHLIRQLAASNRLQGLARRTILQAIAQHRAATM